MNYNNFKERCARNNKDINDKNHFFSKYFSIYIAFICYKIRLSPNNVTFIFLIVGIAAAYTWVLGYPLLFYILWRLHIILDMADGNLARATSRYSKYANGFDKTNHIIINTLVIYYLSSGVHYEWLIPVMISAFGIYYNFNRNFTTIDTSFIKNFNPTKAFMKNLLGLEGFIFIRVMIEEFQMPIVDFAVIMYIILFISIGLVKYYYMRLNDV